MIMIRPALIGRADHTALVGTADVAQAIGQRLLHIGRGRVGLFHPI